MLVVTLQERRSNYNVYVWESVETNKVIIGKTYDKVVTTQYLSSSVSFILKAQLIKYLHSYYNTFCFQFQNDMFRGYSPVSAIMKAYNKNDKVRAQLKCLIFNFRLI